MQMIAVVALPERATRLSSADWRAAWRGSSKVYGGVYEAAKSARLCTFIANILGVGEKIPQETY